MTSTYLQQAVSLKSLKDIALAKMLRLFHRGANCLEMWAVHDCATGSHACGFSPVESDLFSFSSLHTSCFSYFYAAMIKTNTKQTNNNTDQKEFIWTHSSRRICVHHGRRTWWQAASQEAEKTHLQLHIWCKEWTGRGWDSQKWLPGMNLLEVQQHLPNSPNCGSGVQNVGLWHRYPIQTATLTL